MLTMATAPLLSRLGHAQVLVNVNDTLKNADGTNASGRLVISWDPFTTAAGVTIDGGTISYTITNGAINLSLTPNIGATPTGTSYRAQYFLTSGASYRETWVVPASGPATIAQVRVTVPPSPTVTINAATQLAGVAPLANGGTNRGTAWTASRCVQVNATGTALEPAAAACSAGGGSLTTREVDGAPSISGTAIVEFDQADGLVLTNPSGTTARLDLSDVPDAAVSDAITLTNITQVTNRAISDTTGDLAASRVDDGSAASTQALFSGGAGAAGFRAIADGDIPAAIARDSEINVQGTANEITSSGSGPTPTLSIAATLDLSGKVLQGASPLVLEGSGADANETTVAVTNPTADRTFTIPNADSVAVQPLTCSGTDKVSAISGAGVITCTADQTGGGSSHNLLSATHTDTTTGTVARGDIITGQTATPVWQRLALGSTNTFLGSNGTDAGWTAPSGGGSVLGTGRTISTSGAALSGGGDLSANRTITLSASPDSASVVGTGRTLTGGAGIGAIGDLSQDRTIATASQEAAFLANGGATSLTCGGSNQGKMQVMDAGTLEFCDGATTSVLQRPINDPGSNGMLSRTAAGVVTPRTITGDSEIAVANGNGVSGNPTLSIAASLTRDSEINVQGTANEITSSGSGVAPTLSLAAQLNVSGKEIIGGATPVRFEGATDDNLYSQFTFTDPTATRTHTFPNANSNTVQPLTCSGTDKVSAIAADGTITCSTDQGGAGSGDNITVNATAATDANLNDTDPAAPSNAVNVKWQIDTTDTPDNIAAHLLLTDIDGTGIGVSGTELTSASGETGFLASGALTCGAATAGKAQVHTTPLQYCDNAGTPALQYTAYGNSTGESTAAANDSVALTTDTSGNYVGSITNGDGITGGNGGSEGAALTLGFSYGDTLSGNPAMDAEECRFSTDGTGGGLICEGTVADTNEGLIAFDVTGSDKTVTIQNATTTLVGRDTTDTLTNKDVDCEDTGNTCTTVTRIVFDAATCIGATGSRNGDDTPNLAEPAASCVTFGSSPNGVTLGIASHDPGTDEGFLWRTELPSDWASGESTDFDFIWYTSDTTGTQDVVWGARTSCRAVGEAWNATWNTANTVTDTVQGTTNTRNTASITAITMTGCSAGETLFLEIFRDADNASDDAPSDAHLVTVILTYRRDQ
jgi:hypothetical protein